MDHEVFDLSMTTHAVAVGKPVVVGNSDEGDNSVAGAADQHGQQSTSATATSQERLLNTKALDGLRGVAVFHIVLGHHSIYTKFTDVEKDGFSDGFDLQGGISMGLFYILSGFVLMLGYGGYDKPRHEGDNNGCCHCLCTCLDGCCSCYCTKQDRADVAIEPSSSSPSASFDLKKFYWKRFARLGPLWYLGNLLAVPLFVVGNHHWTGGPERWWPGLLLAIPPLGLNSWLMTFPPAGHLWTISTMTFFYFTFPRLCYRVRRIKPHKIRSFAMTLYIIQASLMFAWLIVLLFLTGSPALGYWVARAWPPNRLPVFVMGLCAARQCELETLDPALVQHCCCLRNSDGIGKGSKNMLLWAVFLLVICHGLSEQLLIPGNSGGAVRFLGEVMLPAVFYELIMALAYPASESTPPSRLHGILGSRFMRAVAQISLAVYVIHETLIRSLVWVVDGPVPDGGDQEHPLMPLWGIAVTLPLSVILGWLLTEFFEKLVARIILAWAFRAE